MNINIFSKEKIKEHYNINIYQKNKEKLLLGGKGDKYLKNVKIDNRMSLVLLIRIPPEIGDKIEKCISELKVIEPNVYYYPKSDFHITVIDILKGEENRVIPQNLNEYIQCIKECVGKIKPFKIEFNGITASDNAIMVKGYYEYELQKLRDLLRKTLKEKGLKLEERYESISSHITIMRIPERIEKPKDLLEFVEKERIFGIMEVNSLELSFHNWYDTKKEILSIINI